MNAMEHAEHICGALGLGRDTALLSGLATYLSENVAPEASQVMTREEAIVELLEQERKRTVWRCAKIALELISLLNSSTSFTRTRPASRRRERHKDMGDNARFTQWEATVMAIYNQGRLDQELLSTLMEVHRNSGIDNGGMRGTLANDGLDCEEIVLKVFGVDIPVRPDLPKDYRTWTGEQRTLNEAYWEARSEAFQKISQGRFGWA